MQTLAEQSSLPYTLEKPKKLPEFVILSSAFHLYNYDQSSLKPL